MPINVRKVKLTDRDRWDGLFQGYCDFYQVETSREKRDLVWKWLFDDNHVTNCIVAELDGQVVGLAHYRAMPSQLRACDIGFLDDLFVDPTVRGSGAVQALMDELKLIADEKGWPNIRWLTAENNYRARNLYDKYADKTVFLTYNLTV